MPNRSPLAVAELGPLGSGDGDPLALMRVQGARRLRLDDTRAGLEFHAYPPGHRPPAGLAAVVEMRERLAPAERRRLDELTQWPVRVVVADGSDGPAVGFVAPVLPDAVTSVVTLPSGTRRRLRHEAQHLMAAPARGRRLGLPVPDAAVRWAVARDAAEIVGFLHSLDPGLAVGPLGARRVLFRADRAPRLVLTGCDTVAVRADAAARAADGRELGLFVMRCLAPGPFASVRLVAVPGAGLLDDDGEDLLGRALEGTDGQVPTPDEWFRYLAERAGHDEPPRLRSVALDRSITPAGEPVTVRWAADRASALTVSGPGCETVRFAVSGRSGGVAVVPRRTGRLTVTAHNDRGRHEITTGPVGVYDVPPMGDLPIPLPPLSWPATPSLPDMAAALPAMRFPAVPELPAPAAPRAVFGAPPATSPEPRFALPEPPALAGGAMAFPIDLTALFTAPAGWPGSSHVDEEVQW